MSIEAMKRALEALENAEYGDYDKRELNNAITSLRQAIEEAEKQEPVPWQGCDLDGMVEAFDRVIEAHFFRKNPFHNPIDADAQMALRILRGFIPYMKQYTTPQPQQAEKQEPVACQYGNGGYACCEGGPCKAEEQNNAAPVQEPIGTLNIWFYKGHGNYDFDYWGSLGEGTYTVHVAKSEAPSHNSTCNETLRAQGKPYPRTCKKCGLGPCIGKPKSDTTPPAAPVQEPDYKALYEKAAKQYNELAALMDQTAPVQEPKMYEDWYDSASCGHCGMVNGHTQHCRTVTRTAATKISKHEPVIDLSGYAGTYGPVIDHSCKDTYELIMKWADIYAAQTGNLYAQAAQDPSKVARMADERTMLACVVAQAISQPTEPDLLNALKRIVDEPNNTMSDGKALKEIIRIARRAITKATGEKT
jgi:hypothetical protein